MRMNQIVWKSAIWGTIAWMLIAWLHAGRVAAQEGKPAVKAERPAAATSADERGAPAEVVVPLHPIEMMKKGGPVMFLLAFCSVIGVAFVFERLAALRRSRVIPKPFVTRFLQQVRDGDLDRERALALCEDNPSPIATLFTGGARKWGRPSVEVEQAVIDAGERATYGLRRYLRVFTALAVIGPLLGLLGTVIGMIHAFNAVANDATRGAAVSAQLGKGISEALLNTAFGLVLAIPAQSLYLYFVSRVDRLVIEMDGLGQELVQMISAEELQGRPKRPRKDGTP